MTTNETNIHLLVARCTKNTNLTAAVAKVIDMAPKEEKTNLFIRFLYESRYIFNDESCSIYKEFKDEPTREVIEAKKIINNFFAEYNDSGISEEEFHEKLWNLICEKAGDDNRKKAILLRACTIVDDLPYINKNRTLTLTQDEFKKELEKLDPVYEPMIKHVGEQIFPQITEDASLFLPIIESGKDKQEKTILLTLTLMTFRAQILTHALMNYFQDKEDDCE